ncbi:MAG: sugar phosphate isomerase/epimerase [Ruminococcaceae bacterium]|nr:sugar phosphate isomerase/epimerase [Oscillospiraceae bacterium]
MKISTEINSIARIVGMERAVELCAKAGFDAWDLSMFDMCRIDWKTMQPIETDSPLSGGNYLSFVKKLREIGEDNGIVCNQSHAPFPVHVAAVRSYLKRAIECTAQAGGGICVIHPDNNKTPEENAEMYFELLPFAKDCGVKIATENMWNWDKVKDESSFAACATADSFKNHIDAVNDSYLVACLDIGHAEMRGSGNGAVNMINALGDSLQALHIHDNDCWHDSHQIPFSMNIDFDAIVKALKKVGYKGYFTLEADRFLKPYCEDNVFEGVVKLCESARRLADMFDSDGI